MSIISFLRGLRVLRGETIHDQINYNFPDNRFVESYRFKKMGYLKYSIFNLQ